MAAPAKDGDNFVLDMATTSVALGKVMVFAKSTSIQTRAVIEVSGITLTYSLCPDRTTGKEGRIHAKWLGNRQRRKGNYYCIIVQIQYG